MTNQQAPYSESAEQAVIGAVLTHPLYYLNIAAFLTSGDFFFIKHGYIWDAFGRLEQAQTPIDTVTVSEELMAHSQLAEVGGPAYLTQLVANTPTSRHAEVYGGMVKYASQRRQMLKALDEAKVLVFDETMNVNKLFAQVESKVLAVTVADKKQEETGIDLITHEYMNDVEKMIKLRGDGIFPGLPTGITSYDNICGGSYKQELLVTAGPSKSGKSTFNLNIARNRLKAGATIVIFITEMNRQAIVRRLVSMEANIHIDTLKNGTFSPQEYSRFVEASKHIAKWKLDIVDGYNPLSPLDVRRELRRIMHNKSVDCVLIDGLWQMKSTNKIEARDQEITSIMIDLVEIANKLNIAIDLVHQCSRAADSRRDPHPRLSDLAESAGVDRNAYTLVFLFRENYYKRDGSDETEVIVAANRDGNTGMCKLGFVKQSQTYCELKSIGRQYIPATTIDDTRKDIHQ